jgi:hypothetical protein
MKSIGTLKAVSNDVAEKVKQAAKLQLQISCVML